MSPAVRALVEAARRAHLIDAGMSKRLVTAAAGVSDVAELARFLAGPDGPGGQLSGRLGSLLAAPDATFGAWRPQARLLDGSAGEAWLASDGSGPLALLRVLPAAGLGSESTLAPAEARRRFLRQFEVCQQLNHPHIVGLLGSGELTDGGMWFAVEYAESGDLSDLLRLYGGRLAETQALGLGAQIAGALAELDRLGLVHRAISPAAIIVSADGSAKLGNLFQARSSETSDFTIMGTIVRSDGDCTWMPPEAVLDAGDWTIRSDVYALGCVLFACLSGRPPFIGASPEVMHGHVTQPPPDLRSLVPGLDGASVDAINACLAKEPSRRPTARLLSEVLLAARARLVNRSELSSRYSSGATNRERTPSSLRSPRPGTAPRRRRISLAGAFTDVPMNEVLQTLSRVKATGVLQMYDAYGVAQGLVVLDGEPAGLLADEAELSELAERLCDVPGIDLTRIRSLLAGPGTPAERLAALSRDGLVAEAALVEELTAQLFDAITRRFLENAGDFTFLSDDGEDDLAEAAVAIARQRPLTINLNRLLMEAARQLDEWTALHRRLPGPWALPVLDPIRAEAARVEYAWWPERAVLATVDGATSLGGVIALARATSCAAVRLIAKLTESGDLGFVPFETLIARAEALANQPLAAEPYARAALATRPGDPRAVLAFARCLAAIDFDHRAEALLITPAPTTARTIDQGLSEAVHAALTPIPTATVVGRIEDAYAGEWLALLSAADGSGLGLHLFAADLLGEVQLGKLAKPPVLLSLRKYPEQLFLNESQQLSRSHCALALSDSGATLRDLGAVNGTWLDGVRLAANGEAPLLSRREHRLHLAGVIDLNLRLLTLSARLPQVPGTPMPESALSALAIERLGNRPELAYALVRHRLGVGGAGAELCLPGFAPGVQLLIGRSAGRWLWSMVPQFSIWKPLMLGQPISVGGMTLQAAAGSYGFYH